MKRIISILILLLAFGSAYAQISLKARITTYQQKVNDSIRNRTGDRVIRPSNVGDRYIDLSNILGFAIDSLHAANLNPSLQSVIDVNDTFETPIVYRGTDAIPFSMYFGNLRRTIIGLGVIGTQYYNSVLSFVSSDSSDQRIQFQTTTGVGKIRMPVITGAVEDTLPNYSGTFAMLRQGTLRLDHIAPTTVATLTATAYGGAGTGAAASAIGNYMAGLVTINSGSSPTAGDTVFSVTFPKTMSTLSILLFPMSQAAAQVTPYYFAGYNNVGANTFTLFFKSAATLSGSQSYSWSYFIVNQ